MQVLLVEIQKEAKQLVMMTDEQLLQPSSLSLLDDMVKQANYAFVGQFDPNTTTVKEGVAQIHDNIQQLATFDVTPCTINNGQNTCS